MTQPAANGSRAMNSVNSPPSRASSPRVIPRYREPAAIQLRYLQTLLEVSAGQSATIVFPMPIDLIESFVRAR